MPPAYKTVYKNVKSDETAKSAASRLLTNVNVKKYIDDRMEELHNEKTADAQEVIEYLSLSFVEKALHRKL
jgi:phage terminase small subunit